MHALTDVTEKVDSRQMDIFSKTKYNQLVAESWPSMMVTCLSPMKPLHNPPKDQKINLS